MRERRWHPHTGHVPSQPERLAASREHHGSGASAGDADHPPPRTSRSFGVEGDASSRGFAINLGVWVSSLSPRERAQAGHFCPAYASRYPPQANPQPDPVDSSETPRSAPRETRPQACRDEGDAIWRKSQRLQGQGWNPVRRLRETRPLACRGEGDAVKRKSQRLQGLGWNPVDS